MPLLVIFAAVTMFNYFRNGYLRSILQIMLIALFAVKSCDLLISYYSAQNKAAMVEKMAEEDSSNDVSQDSFEKIDKKLYSGVEMGFSILSFTQIKHIPAPISIYSFSIFTEPLRVVLTPPPNFVS